MGQMSDGGRAVGGNRVELDCWTVEEVLAAAWKRREPPSRLLAEAGLCGVEERAGRDPENAGDRD